MIAGVIDLTTHDLIDEQSGGEHTAGPDRMETATAIGITQIVISGSTDYIVLGAFADLKNSLKREERRCTTRR